MNIGSISIFSWTSTDREKEIQALREDLQISPDDGDLHLRLAVWYHTNGDIAPALAEYERAITLLERQSHSNSKEIPSSLIVGHRLIAGCYRDNHQPERSALHLRAILTILDEIPEPQRYRHPFYWQTKASLQRLTRK